jgi:hypothetical protein
MHERNNFRVTMRHDVSWETFERRASRTARINDRRDARVYSTHVRIDAESRARFENVRVQIDHSGRDDRARRLYDAPCLLARYRLCYMRNLAILDRDVVDTVQAGGRVDYGATFENQIVHG